jgi:hypothetical protein
VKELLPAEEEVLAAIVVWTGSKPWREGLYTLISGLLGQLPGRPAGPYFTLAVTNQGVVRFRNQQAGSELGRLQRLLKQGQ